MEKDTFSFVYKNKTYVYNSVQATIIVGKMVENSLRWKLSDKYNRKKIEKENLILGKSLYKGE